MRNTQHNTTQRNTTQHNTSFCKAFSVAEALIVLLIFAVWLAMSTPLFTKRTKSAIPDMVSNVPSGAVMYFDPDFRTSCPDGWSDVSSKYEGRYIRIAGSFDVCDKSGESEGSCSGNKTTKTVSAGTLQGDSMRRITGTFPGEDADVTMYKGYDSSIGLHNSYVKNLEDYKILSGAFGFVKPSDAGDAWDVENYEQMLYSPNNSTLKEFSTVGDFIRYIDPSLLSAVNSGAYHFFLTKFDSALVTPTDYEVRPKSVAMLACRKD